MILRSVSILAVLTTLSRILGLVRSILIARFLGTTFVGDAFLMAYKIPNLLRRFVGEGSVSAAFIPVFSDVKNEAKGNVKKESHFLSQFYSLSFIVLFIICLLGIIFSPYFVRVIYSFGIYNADCAVFLTRYMFFYLLFISLSAITGGVLNANKNFSTPALSPIVLNIVMILSAFLFTPLIPDSLVLKIFPTVIKDSSQILLMNTLKAALSFSSAVLIGGLCQLLVQLPLFFKIGYSLVFTTKFSDPHLSQIGRLLLPGLFGMGIYQINTIVADPFILAYLDEGCISALNYSNRLIEVSLGIFVISVSTVVLPSLSEKASKSDWAGYKVLLERSVKSIVFISLPAMCGLIILRQPIISMLFKSGLFNDESVQLVSDALFYHSIGIIAIGLYRIYAPAFYALKDTKTPVISALISLIVNVILCFILPPLMGIGGIALASSLSAFVNAIFLMRKLKKKNPKLHFSFFNRTFYVSVLSTVCMSLAIILTSKLYLIFEGRVWVLVLTLLNVILGVSIYLICCSLFKIEELEEIKIKIKKKIGLINVTG